MPTLEWFVRMLNGCIHEKRPFLAYWHMNGYCVLYTGAVTRPVYLIHYADGDAVEYDTPREREAAVVFARRQGRRINRLDIQEKPLPPVTKTSVKEFWKIVKRLRRMPGPVYTAEFDGANLSTEGGIELDRPE